MFVEILKKFCLRDMVLTELQLLLKQQVITIIEPLQMLGVILMSAVSSCYRHHVCATYVKADKKVEIKSDYSFISEGSKLTLV